MPDRFGEPWSGTTYNGFSGTGPAAPGSQVPPHDHDGLRMARPELRQFAPHEYRRSPRRRGPRRGLLLGGLAAALGLGALFGLVARPDLALDEAPRGPMQPVTTAEQAATPVPIVVNPPPPATPAPQSSGRLEVLPPEMARAAETRPAPAAPREMAQAPAPPAPREAAPAPEPVDVAARAPEPAPSEPAPVVAERPQAEPGFNCRYARSRSERLVCADPQLATLDRRLNRAFERAVASGVPYRDLRAEQDDWLTIREDAARRGGPEAVESVYRQRIRELNEMAQLTARF